MINITSSDGPNSTLEMKMEFTELMTKNFCDENYVNCTGLNLNTCVTSLKDAVKSCPIENLYHVINEDNSAKTHEQKLAEIETESNKFGSCVIKVFQDNEGVDLNKFPQCDIPHIRTGQ